MSRLALLLKKYFNNISKIIGKNKIVSTNVKNESQKNTKVIEKFLIKLLFFKKLS